MSRVVLAGAGEDLILRVKQATDGDVSVLPPGRLPGDPARLFEQLLDGELPDVLLVGPHAPAPEVLTLAARLDVQSPGISVVLMAEPSPEMWQAAMRAGIRDLLDPAAGEPETASAGAPAPSSSLMITFAVTAAQAEAVVYGVEHASLWLSLEPEGADIRGTAPVTAETIYGKAFS